MHIACTSSVAAKNTCLGTAQVVVVFAILSHVVSTDSECKCQVMAVVHSSALCCMSWHFSETPGIKPRLGQYSHGVRVAKRSWREPAS